MSKRKRRDTNRLKELNAVEGIVYHTILTLVKVYSIDKKTLAMLLKKIYHLFDNYYRED